MYNSELTGNKINIRLSDKTKAVIENDKIMFRCNKYADFIDRVFIGMYDDTINNLRDMAQEEYDGLEDQYLITVEDIMERMVKDYHNSIYNDYNKYQKTYLKESTVDILNYNDFYTKQGFASKITSYILGVYATKPYCERERIFFSNSINKMLSSGKINIRRDGKTYSVIPYKVIADDYTTSNYLLGYIENADSLTPASFKIVLIDSITPKSSKRVLSNKEKEYLDNLVSERGVQYIYGEEIDVKVKLSSEGKNLIRRVVNQRPICYAVDEDYYYFRCSFLQAQVYFQKIGKDAIVVEPEELATKIKEHYENALKEYE